MRNLIKQMKYLFCKHHYENYFGVQNSLFVNSLSGSYKKCSKCSKIKK